MGRTSKKTLTKIILDEGETLWKLGLLSWELPR